MKETTGILKRDFMNSTGIFTTVGAIEPLIDATLHLVETQASNSATQIHQELSRLPQWMSVRVIDGVIDKLAKTNADLCRWFAVEMLYSQADAVTKEIARETVDILIAQVTR